MIKNLLKNTDYILLACILILFGIGIAGIYSAGYATDVNKDEYIKQAIWFGVVCIMMIVVWLVNYKIFDKIGYVLYVINLILLVVVLAMPKLMGASSWFNLGGILYQPSELMKIGFILTFAKCLSTFCETGKTEKVKRRILVLVMALMFIVPVLLIAKQPDFGTAAVFCFILAFMMFKTKIKYRYIFLGIVGVIICVPLIYFFVLNPTQQQRIKVFINPNLDPLGSGYNAIQSKIAVGSGQMFGTGFLEGTQTQYGYLPIKSTDFIFSVISEELGFIASATIIITFVVLLIRIIKIAKEAPDQFSGFVVIGIAGMIFFHFFENIGMTIGLLPITGVPLPFVSYGGSSLITNGLAMGIVLSIGARKNMNSFFN